MASCWLRAGSTLQIEGALASEMARLEVAMADPSQAGDMESLVER